MHSFDVESPFSEPSVHQKYKEFQENFFLKLITNYFR